MPVPLSSAKPPAFTPAIPPRRFTAARVVSLLPILSPAKAIFMALSDFSSAFSAYAL
ncbi:hypothetical protein D3C80_1807710 [compost metagenome]